MHTPDITTQKDVNNSKFRQVIKKGIGHEDFGPWSVSLMWLVFLFLLECLNNSGVIPFSDRQWLHQALKLARQYQAYLISIAVAFLTLLHTVHSFVKGLVPKYLGIRRTLLRKTYLPASSSCLLKISWFYLALSFVAVLLNWYLLFLILFVYVFGISIVLCGRYLFLASTRKLSKRLDSIEAELHDCGSISSKSMTTQKVALAHLKKHEQLFLDFLGNEESRAYTFAAILFRNHNYMSPAALIVYMCIGMMYYSFAILSGEYDQKTVDDFTKVCAQIFKQNARSDLKMGINSFDLWFEKLEPWVIVLGKHFNLGYSQMHQCALDIKEDVWNLLREQDYRLAAPSCLLTAQIHQYILNGTEGYEYETNRKNKESCTIQA